MRRLILAMLLLASGLLPAAPARAQAPTGLDQPLHTANQCGDGSESYFTIAATGDTFPHDNIQAVGEAQGYDILFDNVRPFLQAADLAYTNFDGAMLAGAGLSGYPNFNYNPALATALKNSGIGLVSTANNHILDRGPAGIDATLSVLAENGIAQHGTVSSTASERPPYLPLALSHNGITITIGFVSASWGTNGIADPNNQVNLLYESNEYGAQGGVRQSVLDAIAQADRETDLVLVAAHWGTEYQFYPDPSQVEAARRMAEAGADVILGAQPHTLQPVDLLDVGGRNVLVIYSLANFLASQGAFQAESFSATSVIFYVGLARAANGDVRVTGYRYLPTIHVDNDTRPAPIPNGAEPAVIDHVRTIMRDPDGMHQLDPNPAALNGRVEVCPALVLAEAPTVPIPGDFAQHYTAIGGLAPRPLPEAIAVFGLPLGPVHKELAGDCVTPVAVLLTERQRLELHPENEWPFRVAGTQLGVEAFERRYPDAPLIRRADLAAADAFVDPSFRAFYESRGGLAIFGYPISGAVEEQDAGGGTRTVQYFERARFELAPGAAAGAALGAQVQLGLLGREFPGITAICGGTARAPADDVDETAAATQGANADGVRAEGQTTPLLEATLAQVVGGASPWLPILAAVALLATIAALASFALADWRSYQRRGARGSYRYRRSAHERFAPSVELQRRATAESPQAQRAPSRADAAIAYVPPPAPPADEDEDELLRRLLEG